MLKNPDNLTCYEHAIVRRLEELTAADASRFGGKAVQCGVLLQAGFPVPEGIAVAFDANERPHLPNEARAWIESRPAMRFAVRSSAADEDGAGHSFAGIHESVLDIDAQQIEEAITECVGSMSSDRARTYRAARGLELANGAAILIQRMIEPQRAGVAFTVDPVSGDRETIVINAAAGRGEAVVSGTVMPEETRVRKSEVRDPLAKLMLRVEEHYGAPQDIEWCDDGAALWIVQSRPITSLQVEDRHSCLSGQAGVPVLHDGVEWTRANIREVMPDLPAPGIAETLCKALDDAYHRFYGKMIDRSYGPLIRLINGRMYFNMTQFRRMARLGGESDATVLRALGHSGDIQPEDEVRPKLNPRELLRLWRPLAKLIWHQLTLTYHLPRWTKAMEKYREEIGKIDIANASDEEILVRIYEWRDEIAYRFIFPAFLLGTVMTVERMVRDLCAKRDVGGDRVLHTWLGAGERSVSSQQAMDLLRVARGEMELETFLELYGHRGIFESDWSMPRFAEDPTPIHEAIRAHRAAGEIPDPDEIAARQQRAWDALWRELRPRFGWLERKRLESMLRRIKWMYLWRERYRSEMVRVVVVQRKWHRELAKRAVARGWLDDEYQTFALTLDDYDSDPSQYRAIAAEKWRKHAEYAKIEMPLLLVEGRPLRAPEPAAEAAAAPLRGLCVSSGWVEAPVAVLQHPSEIARFPRGAILVAQATDPSWTPLFTLAGGVIVEIGGTLSHAATVAREMGLPALANVRDATKILKDGMVVRLDATNGYAAIV